MPTPALKKLNHVRRGLRMEFLKTNCGLVNVQHIVRIYTELTGSNGKTNTTMFAEMQDHTHYIVIDTRVYKLVSDTVIYDLKEHV